MSSNPSMPCPVCGGRMLAVWTRKRGQVIARRRRCKRCKFSVKTFETRPTQKDAVEYVAKRAANG